MKELFADKKIRWAIAIFAFILIGLFIKKQIEKESEERRNKNASKATVNNSALEFNRDTYKNLAKRFVDAFKGIANPFSSDFGTDKDPRVSVMGDVLLFNDDGIKQTANDIVALSGETMRSWVEGDTVPHDMKPNFLNRLSEIGL